MAEPKFLPPSLRSHKRYVVFEVTSDNPVAYNELINAIWNSALNFLGELEASNSMLWSIQNLYDEKSQRGVLKCRHDFVENIRVILSLIQTVGETKAIIKVLGVTGTIKSARNKYLLSKDLRNFFENKKATR
jgi:ribonuclease P/MRP protein subunit POP5